MASRSRQPLLSPCESPSDPQPNQPSSAKQNPKAKKTKNKKKKNTDKHLLPTLTDLYSQSQSTTPQRTKNNKKNNGTKRKKPDLQLRNTKSCKKKPFESASARVCMRKLIRKPRSENLCYGNHDLQQQQQQQNGSKPRRSQNTDIKAW